MTSLHGAVADTKPTSRSLPMAFYIANTLGLVLATALLIAFIIVSFQTFPPYDYGLLMRGADSFCYTPSQFVYGRLYDNYYPAPFYTTFCVPLRLAPDLLRLLWIAVPFALVVVLSGWRAGVFASPALFILFLLGQSTWLLLPLYILGVRYSEGARVRAWHGVLLGLAVLKPHIALPAALYLLWHWRRHRWALVWAVVSVLVITLPSFLIMPDWPIKWLSNTRGFEPINLASIAFLPRNGLDLPPIPSTGTQMLVWLFCGAIAYALYRLLLWRRGRVTWYDLVLIYFLTLPLTNDYDLVVLLPFIGDRPRRLLLSNTAGILAWIIVAFTFVNLDKARWSMSFFITFILLVARFARLDEARWAAKAPPIRW